MTTSANDTEPLRIGVLGAARICDEAVIEPAHLLGARLVAVAARDRGRAQEFADRHGFETAYDDYQAVLDDPDVEVVYNPLVNSLHAPWNLRAVAAGKSVLTEKPFASNAGEAAAVRDASVAAGVPVIEAFHHTYHPLMARMRELASGGESGEIGELRYVEARMLMPPPDAGDPRWSAELAGGGLMDVGCYAVQTIRQLAAGGPEPEVVSAAAGEPADRPGVDGWLTAELALPGGVLARVESGMTHHTVDFSLRLVGSRGEAYAPSFVKAHLDDRVLLTVGADRRTEHCGRRSTYTFQLEALTRLIRAGVPMSTDADEGLRNMVLIDAVYRAAGLSPRLT